MWMNAIEKFTTAVTMLIVTIRMVHTTVTACQGSMEMGHIVRILMNAIRMVTTVMIMPPALTLMVPTIARAILVIQEMDMHALKSMSVIQLISVVKMQHARTPLVHIHANAR